MHLFAHLAHACVLAVVHLAIVEGKFDVARKLDDVRVLLLLQFALNRAEIHRVPHDLQVVGNLQLLPIYGLQENPRALVAGKSH